MRTKKQRVREEGREGEGEPWRGPGGTPGVSGQRYRVARAQAALWATHTHAHTQALGKAGTAAPCGECL